MLPANKSLIPDLQKISNRVTKFNAFQLIHQNGQSTRTVANLILQRKKKLRLKNEIKIFKFVSLAFDRISRALYIFAFRLS